MKLFPLLILFSNSLFAQLGNNLCLVLMEMLRLVFMCHQVRLLSACFFFYKCSKFIEVPTCNDLFFFASSQKVSFDKLWYVLAVCELIYFWSNYCGTVLFFFWINKKSYLLKNKKMSTLWNFSNVFLFYKNYFNNYIISFTSKMIKKHPFL